MWRKLCRYLVLLVYTLANLRPSYGFSNVTAEEIPDWYRNLSGNSLWDTLLVECKRPTMACVQKNFFHYLDDLLDYPHPYTIADFITISKNTVDFKADDLQNEEDEIPRSSPIENVTDALHNKTVKFLMTHDIEIELPEVVFDGSILKLSPRSLEDSGALIKLDLIPQEAKNVSETPRIFFKKIKKFISEKLLVALLAILLVIKLVAVKLMFFMPMIMGVAAAKKLLLKVLLFVFPAISHVFKLCPYYQGAHNTKFHHHHHHISHLHRLPHHNVDLSHPPPHHSSFDIDNTLEYSSDGPSFVNDYLHRNDVRPEENDVNFGPNPNRRIRKPTPNNKLTPSEIENLALKAEKEAVLKARLQQEQLRIRAENMRLQQQIKDGLKLQEKLRSQQTSVTSHNSRIAPAAPPAVGVLAGPMLGQPSQNLQAPKAPQAQALQSPFRTQPVQPVPLNGFQDEIQQAAAVTYDPFYSPILDRIDKVLGGIGFADEPCRERLICSMYKNPNKFSPHSNLVSAELSRDAKELQKPTTTNAAVIRFYKYVQAARDGQDNRDCLRLYPACNINTEN